MASVADVATPTTRTRRLTFSEDWLAVAVSAVVVALALAGIRPPAPRLAWTTASELAALAAAENLSRLLALFVLLLVPTATGALLMGARAGAFAAGFTVLFALALLAQLASANAAVSAWGLEYVLFALLVGMAARRLAPIPAWLTEAIRTEYYIKTGLVVLGASILFNEIVRAGALGLTQALVVVLSVWFFSFWLARRLRVDDELATMMASAVAICGVSAAIAACGAIQGDRKKLSYVTSLVLVVAVPMMVVMPWIARATGMPEVVAGAWLGGTLDTSAAVVAAGEMVSETARDAAVVVKLSQNALIGIAAFLLTIWWAFRESQKGDPGKTGAGAARPSLGVIWDRFPKFVLGFLAVSFVFSFVLGQALVADTRGILGALRTTWFAMAFVSIGLETSLTGLVTTEEGRPAAAFLGGQAFNIVVTLIAAYLLFGGVLLPAPEF
jgi:uncharacterized membrane protein YadS